ncbi:taste receptor type 2 member 7-like [Centroberyx affinis]|uniref:taste receptor type 2 member 7-like n=1 Tax=Centroberyx affinis TaxID=166261 RepID=UPI003A5BD24B
MDLLPCVLINGPLIVLNILANLFYIFCMVCPHGRERIKQPLKLLLWTLICCTLIYLMSVILMFFSGMSDNVNFAAYLLGVYTLSSSLNASVWLNFFYYTQIVPAQRAVFIWIKRNIKAIIYCILLADRVFSLFDFTVMTLTRHTLDGFNRNFTTHRNVTLISSTSSFETKLYHAYDICSIMIMAQSLFCLCVMVGSSGATVIYLHRHIRRMIASGTPCPRLRSQMRVTITGIIQGVIYLLCAVFSLVHLFSLKNSNSYFSECILHTVITLYMSGTTVNLGVGQAIFRRRAADVWLKAAQCGKVLL